MSVHNTSEQSERDQENKFFCLYNTVCYPIDCIGEQMATSAFSSAVTPRPRRQLLGTTMSTTDTTDPVWREGGWSKYSDTNTDHCAMDAHHILIAVSI